MMEIPPGNIDHFELKCRSLQEVKKIFFKWSNWSWCTKKIQISHLIKKVADECCERMKDSCEVWYIGSWFLQKFSCNLRLRFQKLKSVSISLWISSGHFHQIIHFWYYLFWSIWICTSIVKFVVSPKTQNLIFWKYSEYRFHARNSCIKTRSSMENPKTLKVWIGFVWRKYTNV
jgi:hypothetical protein